MAKSEVRWDGLDEYKALLRQLPEACNVEAGHAVEEAVNRAYTTVSEVYGAHRFTGNLQKGLKIATLNKGAYGTGRILRSTAPHAWLFDNGSQARHWLSGKSTGRMWGKTPPTHVFVQTVIRERRRLYDRVKDMLRRKGAVVTGEAA